MPIGLARRERHLPRGHASDRMNSRVLSAFRDVVKQPSQSTVRVLGDGKKLSLGTIVGAQGYVATKASELKGKLEVQLFSGKKYDAKLIGSDRLLDLALVKIDATDLPVIHWAEESSPPSVGNWLATPGLERDPVAIGVLSVGARKIPAPSGALGILLDQNEEVVRIVSIKTGSAAEKAGLQVHDIVKKVDAKAITTRRELIETVRTYQPGEKIELLIRRGEDEFTVSAVLDSLNEVLHGDAQEKQNNLGGPLSERRGGFISALQHDTVLKPIDCGGPIVDLEGKAVGLNIARAGRVETYALPAAVVRAALPELLKMGAPVVDNPSAATQPVSSTPNP